MEAVSLLQEPNTLRGCVAALAAMEKCKLAVARAELSDADIVAVEDAESAWQTTVVSAMRVRAEHLDFVSLNVLKNDLRAFARVPASKVSSFFLGVVRQPAGGCGPGCVKTHHDDGMCLVCGKPYADHVGDGHRCKGTCRRCCCCCRRRHRIVVVVVVVSGIVALVLVHVLVLVLALLLLFFLLLFAAVAAAGVVAAAAAATVVVVVVILQSDIALCCAGMCTGASATRACWRVGPGPLVKKRVCFHSSISRLEVAALQQLAEQCGAIVRVQVSQHVDIVVVADNSNIDITYGGVERLSATAFVARAHRAALEHYCFVEEDVSFAGLRKPQRKKKKKAKEQVGASAPPVADQGVPPRPHVAGEFTPSQFQTYDSEATHDVGVAQDAVFNQVAVELEAFWREYAFGDEGVQLSRIYWTSAEQIQELRRCVGLAGVRAVAVHFALIVVVVVAVVDVALTFDA